EGVQARPIGVESVEEFRVDRIGGFQAALVFSFSACRGKLLGLLAIQFGKLPHDCIAYSKELGIGQGLKQAPSYNLKPLLGAGRPPGRLNASKGVLEPFQYCLAGFSTDLDV